MGNASRSPQATRIDLLTCLRDELAASSVGLYELDGDTIRTYAVAGDSWRTPQIDAAELWHLAASFRAAAMPACGEGEWCVATAVSAPNVWGWLIATGSGRRPPAAAGRGARLSRESPGATARPVPGEHETRTALATRICEAFAGDGAAAETALPHGLTYTVDGYVVHDVHGCILAVNDSLCRRTGHIAETLRGLHIDDLVTAGAIPTVATARTALRLGGHHDCRVLAARLRYADDSEVPAELRMGYVLQPSGALFTVGVVLLEPGRGAWGRETAAPPLRLTREAFEATDEAALVIKGGRLVECNAAAVRLFGLHSHAALLRASFSSLAPSHQPDGRESREKARSMLRIARERHFHRFEWRCSDVHGRAFPVEATLATVRFRGRAALQLVLNDISQRKTHESEIERLTHYDPLTALANRHFLQSRAQEAIAAARRHGYQSGVLYLDLDRFKDINETQGHEVGDALLVAAAERLRDSLRDCDLLARLGGDEFAVLIPWVTPDSLAHTAARLLDAIAEPFRVNGTRLRVTASIGAVICPRDGVTLHELLKHADIAMYQAKSEGYAYRLFRPEHGRAIRERVQLERGLEQALENDEIQLAFQARIRCADGTTTSVEALARWRSATGHEVSPERFIPVAEASGLIHPLGRRVLTLACRQAAAWEAAGRPLRMAVNVSAHELRRPGFREDFLAILNAEGITPQRIEVEITETSLMMDTEEHVDTLAALRATGVLVSVDDFGTGYSSLSYLKHLPIDALKIDKSFVREMTDNPLDTGIVDTILALARSLGLETIAEGVETEAQERTLVRMGCSDLQGYRYGRPTAAEALAPWLSQPVPLVR